MGIYALNKRVLDFIPDDTFFGFDHLMYALIENNKKVAVKNHDGIWLDIGRPIDFQNAIDLFEKEGDKFL
jgi:NDP-sugar pyrophosphorylase family protein